MSERRSEGRAKAFWSVVVVKVDKTKVNARSTNVSANGIQLTTKACLKKGEKVLVCVNAFFDGKKQHCCFVGQVAYTTFCSGGQETVVGVQAISRDEEYAEIMRRYLKHRA